MENFVASLEFLGGLACLFAIGHLAGHLLKLDKFYDDFSEKKNQTDQKSSVNH